jgi:hypothetical protein
MLGTDTSIEMTIWLNRASSASRRYYAFDWIILLLDVEGFPCTYMCNPLHFGLQQVWDIVGMWNCYRIFPMESLPLSRLTVNRYIMMTLRLGVMGPETAYVMLLKSASTVLSGTWYDSAKTVPIHIPQATYYKWSELRRTSRSGVTRKTVSIGKTDAISSDFLILNSRARRSNPS